jgi:hypothetical protein
MKATIDDEAVENLDRSLSIIPQIYSIVKDPVTGEIISGVHRQETGKANKEFYLPQGFIEGIAKNLNITREMTVVVLRQHLNIQRQPPEEETRGQLMELAKGYEAMGIPKHLIAQMVVKVSGLSPRRTLELLPDTYKQREKAEAGKAGGAASAATSQQKRTEGIGHQSELGVKTQVPPQRGANGRKGEVCPECGGGLRSYECGSLHCINPNCRNVQAYPTKG